MKKEGYSIIEYQRSGIQGKTSEKADREICGTICNRRSSLIKCSKTMITNFNKNTSSSKCKPDSTVQGTDKRVEKRG